jgi:phosphoribosylaminoimidazolecarboxamide formyltransferase / IMP cyclohydrolase
MNESIMPIRRAIVSVFDKSGLLELARALVRNGVEILASGGTRSTLVRAGMDAIDIAEYTGQPEIMGGRVKTLHPKIHAGILARREEIDDIATLDQLGSAPIDLVVVNLYPFEATVARPASSLAEALENIDIGGPTLVRAAAKNHSHVAVLTSPDQYPGLVAALESRGGTSLEERRELALAAFQRSAAYDAAIATYLAAAGVGTASPSGFQQRLGLDFRLRQELRYGENPHQSAAFYVEPVLRGPSLATAALLHGKDLSYNNLLDLDAALRLVRQFAGPAACILKHNNPCGVALAADLATAFERAYEGDPVSAFGGIVGVNRPVDGATAERMSQSDRFLEAIVAPGFQPEALLWLTTKPSWRNSVRLVALGESVGPSALTPQGFDLRRIEGGLLVQSWDHVEADPAATGTVPTRRAPTDAERRDLSFAWVVCAAVKSNAIVVAKNGQVLGVGAGQMSRLDSVRIAVEKAGDRASGSVLASDAFFPFRDGPDLAAAAGVTAIIQPGGSKRDNETRVACDEHDMAMILTGRRHFRH